MGKTFTRIHICVAGDFQGREEKFKQWTEANGGRYSKEMSSDVTHLITTKHDVRKGVSKGIHFRVYSVPVKEAKKMKKVKIVSAAWLEDSLVTCHRRPKPEGEYLLVGTRKGGRGKRSAKEKKADTKTAESPEKNVSRKKNTTRVQDIIAEMATSGYQLYKDEVNFTYDVKLVRPSQHSNRKERYSMMLFESTTPTTDLDPPTPKTYSTFIAFTAPGKSGEHHLAPPGSPWPLASKSFRNFFKQKTGKMWEERGDGKVPEPKRGVGGEVLPVDEGWFRYEVLVGATAAGEGSGKVVNLVEERDAERDAGGDGGGGADAGEGCGKVVNLVEERDGEGVEQGGVSEGGERGVATVGDSQVKEKVV